MFGSIKWFIVLKNKKIVGFVLLFIMFFSFKNSLADNGLKLQPLTQNVYAIVGELDNRSRTNFANNATFGFVVTEKGIVLIDSGGSYEGAQAIHQMIKTVSDQPIVKVINTGGQDHRWLGNDYFKKIGAQIITSAKAVKDQKQRTDSQFSRLSNLLSSQSLEITHPVYADTTFEDQLSFKLGAEEFELYHSGQAHTPGDIFIWLPKHKVVFTGDIVFTDRMLGVREYSNSKSWINVFEQVAKLQPKHIVPGHGRATDLKTATKDTYQYLIDLRKNVSAFYEDGGDISEIRRVSQLDYQYLYNYYTLSGQNAQQVYSELEWE